MSEIQQYMSSLYASSDRDMFTKPSGIFNPDSPLNKALASGVGGREPIRSIPTYNPNDPQSLSNPYEFKDNNIYSYSPQERQGFDLSEWTSNLEDAFISAGVGTGKRKALNQSVPKTPPPDAPATYGPDGEAPPPGWQPGMQMSQMTASQPPPPQQGSNFLGTGIETTYALNIGATLMGGVEQLVDDQDATTYTAGEVSMDVAGVGIGVGRIVAGDVVGGGIQVATELYDIGSSIFGRKKAREEESKQKKLDISRATKQASYGRLKSQQEALLDRGKAAAEGLAAAQEKYRVNFDEGGEIFSEPYLRFKKQADSGARLSAMEGTRPEDLKKVKYARGGIIKKYKEGGETEEVLPVYMSENWSLNPQTESSKKYMSNLEQSDIAFKKEQSRKKADERYERIMSTGLNKRITNIQDAADMTFAGGIATSNPAATMYGGVVSSGIDIGRALGSTIMSWMHPDEDWSKYQKKHATSMAMNLVPTKGIKKVVKGGEHLVAGYKGGKAVYGTLKNTKTYGEQLLSLLNQGKEDMDEDSKQLAQLVKGGKINHNPEYYYSDSYKKYLGGGKIKYDYNVGGITPGEFSHKENPLKVVDKNGQDTGMELTGGEGVFDQKAMTMLDRYKNNNDYNKAGKLVFKEMDSWVGAGTAKYGTRIKEY